MKTVTQILLTFILNALWQGTLIVGFAALADWLLRGVAPRFRHYLWVVTLFACLIIPALNCLPSSGSARTQQTATAPVGPIPVVTSRIITPGIEDATSRPVIDESPVRNRFSLSRSVPVPILIAFGLVGLYALIVIWRLASLLRAWRRTNQIVAGVFECAFPDWVQERIKQCQSEVGIKLCRVLCSNDIAVPITVGVFDRIVILPQRFANEVSIDVLTSALGHEFQHIARHDYLLNLIYEFIYLPLSFHPAVAFARRRIKHTRELCCDAAVTTKLVSAEVYARSLVKLIGSAPLLPLAPDTTIGMNESDILEVRIMALLKKSNLSSRRRLLLIMAAAVLLITPCVAAARFGLSFETAGQNPKSDSNAQLLQKMERAKIERQVVDLERQAKELKQSLEQTPQSKQDERSALEAKLNEVAQNLEEHRKALEASQLSSQDAEQRLKQILKAYQPKLSPQDAEQRLKQLLEAYQENQPADKAKAKEMEQLLAQAQMNLKSPEAELVHQMMEKLAAEQAASQGDRKARLINHTEPRYTDEARAKGIEGKVVLGFTIDHDGIPQNIQVKRSLYPSLDQAAIEAVRDWRFQPAMKNGQVVSMWTEAEINFSLYQDPQKKEERETRERREEGIEGKVLRDGQELKVRLGNEAGRRAEREAEEKRNAILVGLAKISMDHAIQIATSKAPGKVTECSLVGEHWEGAGELAKPSLVLYHVIILSEDATPTRTHVLVNAQDGSIFRVNKEEKREEEMTGWAAFTSQNATKRAINGGVLNGKAASLPAPSYPAIARAAHASGAVNVQILIDEGGNVIEATPVSGHPLLRAAAQAAAREAKFAPTRMGGEPVMVSGVLVFNFVAQ
jgi:TonB family protein